MTKSNIDEMIVDLYLRLNGYFTTGLIVHSPEWGQARTEIDRLAIRNEFHSQEDRLVGASRFLEIKTPKSELILCEVKSDPNLLSFNDALINNADSISAALRWSGLFHPNNIESLTNDLLDLLKRSNERDRSINIGVECNDIVVRTLLCCPSEKTISDGWVLDGDEVFGFIDMCLNPNERRESCSTRYNFQQWGYPFSRVVRYFKDVSCGAPTAIELYEYMTSAKNAKQSIESVI